jgi:hypothetical protein
MYNIPTTYRGIRYRSRLEARWAAFFDAIGWQHTYEPFDGDGYIPDFLIHGDRRLLIEIKPAASRAEFEAPIEKVTKALDRFWGGDILILGIDPFPRLQNSWGGSIQFPPAGLIGEPSGFDDDVTKEWWFDTGNWFDCGECGDVSVFHDQACYIGRPCGHYDGDHVLVTADRVRLQAAWATATNDVQWRGRATA